jgi:hypothetical protein
MLAHRLEITNWKRSRENGRDHFMVDLLFKNLLGVTQGKHENLQTKIRISFDCH